jgi:hypothetical protein
LQKAFLRLPQAGIIQIDVSIVSLDSAGIKVHSDGMGTLKKEGSSLLEGRAAVETPKFIWSPHRIETP